MQNKEIIIDVRSANEWQNGHADCSVNIPLNQLENEVEYLRNFETIIVVCESGGRAGIAQMKLKACGINKVENLVTWRNVYCKR